MENKSEKKQKESIFIRIDRKWNEFREHRKKRLEKRKEFFKKLEEKKKDRSLVNKIVKVLVIISVILFIVAIFSIGWEILWLAPAIALMGTSELIRKTLLKEENSEDKSEEN